jgi:hypothetical protein
MQISLKALSWIALVVGAATAIVFLSNDNVWVPERSFNCLMWFSLMEYVITVAFVTCVVWCISTGKEAACTYRCIYVFISLTILIWIYLLICLIRI